MVIPVLGIMAPYIKEITISLSIADKEYGKGTEIFQCLKAEYPLPPDNVETVIGDGLDLYFQVWMTLLGTRFASGLIKADEFKSILENTRLRLEMVRKHLKKVPDVKA